MAATEGPSSTRDKLKLKLQLVRVGDVMHQGIISVASGTRVSAVAEVMAARRIHAVVIDDPDQTMGSPMIASAVDVVSALRVGIDPPVGQIAGTEVLTVSSLASLETAAWLMGEHEVSHLIVTDAASGHPTGVLSTLDLMAAVAG